MEEETKTKFKFKCVLFELLKDDYKVTDDTVFEKLITHLSDGDKGLITILMNFLYFDGLMHRLLISVQTKNNGGTTIIVFGLVRRFPYN